MPHRKPGSQTCAAIADDAYVAQVMAMLLSVLGRMPQGVKISLAADAEATPARRAAGLGDARYTRLEGPSDLRCVATIDAFSGIDAKVRKDNLTESGVRIRRTTKTQIPLNAR